MKKLSAILFVLLAVAICNAGTLVFAPQTVNGTAYGPTNSIIGVVVPSATRSIITPNITNASVYVTNIVSGVTNIVNNITNACAVNWQYSLDNTNFITLSTYFPFGTNAGVDNFVPPTYNVTVYVRAQVVTTNPLPFAITQ